MARTVFASATLAALASTATCASLFTRSTSVPFSLQDPYPTYDTSYSCDLTNAQGAGVQCSSSKVQLFSSPLDCQTVTGKPCGTNNDADSSFQNWWQVSPGAEPVTGPVGNSPGFTLRAYRSTINDPMWCEFSCALTGDASAWKCVSGGCGQTLYTSPAACEADQWKFCALQSSETFKGWYEGFSS